MSYKILTKNGIDNSNIDGARGEYFNSGMRDGIVQGALNEGLFTATASNIISLDTCELRIAGHRIVIDEPVYHTFTNAPSSDTRYAFVAQIVVDANQNVDFSLFVQTASTPLMQNDLYKTITGAGTYQVEIGRFTLLTSLTIEDVVRTLDVITGGTGRGGNGSINIGNVITEKIEPEFDAEVDVDTRYEEDENKEYLDFKFSLPIDMTDTINKSNQALSNSQQAIKTANNANTNSSNAVETANNAKVESSQANTKADSAIQTSNEANTSSQQAVETANEAKTIAENALEQVIGEQGTKVYVNEELQTQVKFNSDPQTQITNNTTAISNEISSRQNADTTLQNNIDSEKTAREYADITLQNSLSNKANINSANTFTDEQTFKNGISILDTNNRRVYISNTGNAFYVNVNFGSGNYRDMQLNANGLYVNNHLVMSVNQVSSNCYRFDDGLQICWGTSASSGNNQSLTVSFPLPFVNTSYSFTAGRYWTSSSTGAQSANIRSKTTSNIVVNTQNGGAGNSAGQFDWVVIGRWK